MKVDNICNTIKRYVTPYCQLIKANKILDSHIKNESIQGDIYIDKLSLQNITKRLSEEHARKQSISSKISTLLGFWVTILSLVLPLLKIDNIIIIWVLIVLLINYNIPMIIIGLSSMETTVTYGLGNETEIDINNSNLGALKKDLDSMTKVNLKLHNINALCIRCIKISVVILTISGIITIYDLHSEKCNSVRSATMMKQNYSTEEIITELREVVPQELNKIHCKKGNTKS